MKAGLLLFLFEALGKMKVSHLFNSTVLGVPHVSPRVTNSPLQGAGPSSPPFSQAHTCSPAFPVLPQPLASTSVTLWPREWLPGLPPGLLPDRVTLPVCFFTRKPQQGAEPSLDCPRSHPCASSMPWSWGAEAQSPGCWYWCRTLLGPSSSLPTPVPVGSPPFSPARLAASVRGAAAFPAHPQGMSWLMPAARTLCRHPGARKGAQKGSGERDPPDGEGLGNGAPREPRVWFLSAPMQPTRILFLQLWDETPAPSMAHSVSCCSMSRGSGRCPTVPWQWGTAGGGAQEDERGSEDTQAAAEAVLGEAEDRQEWDGVNRQERLRGWGEVRWGLGSTRCGPPLEAGGLVALVPKAWKASLHQAELNV